MLHLCKLPFFIYKEFEPVPLAETSLFLHLLCISPVHCSFPVTWLPVASNCLDQLRCHGDHAHSAVSQQPLGSPVLTFPTAPSLPACLGPGPPYAPILHKAVCACLCDCPLTVSLFVWQTDRPPTTSNLTRWRIFCVRGEKTNETNSYFFHIFILYWNVQCWRSWNQNCEHTV